MARYQIVKYQAKVDGDIRYVVREIVFGVFTKGFVDRDGTYVWDNIHAGGGARSCLLDSIEEAEEVIQRRKNHLSHKTFTIVKDVPVAKMEKIMEGD